MDAPHASVPGQRSVSMRALLGTAATAGQDRGWFPARVLGVRGCVLRFLCPASADSGDLSSLAGQGLGSEGRRGKKGSGHLLGLPSAF